MLAATALQGCGGVEKLNILAAIDGPYVSPSERAARQQAAAEAEAQLALEAQAAQVAPEPAQAETAAELAIPTLEPQEAVALGIEEPVAELVALPDAEPEPLPEAPLALAPVPVNTAAEGAVIVEPVTDAPLEDESVQAAFADLAIEEPAAVAAIAAPAMPEDEQPAVTSAELATLVEAEPPAPEEREALGPEVAQPAITSVGPGFLPPEMRAPAAPIPASVSTAFIGPVLPREDLQPPAPLETRLPSAFDYVAPAADNAIERRPAPLPEPVTEPQVVAVQPQVETLPAAAMAELARPAPVETVPAATAPAAAQATVGGDLESAAGALGYSVVSAMPSSAATPERAPAAGSASSAYGAFFDFAIARLEAAPAGGARQSMLLLDPPSLDPELQRCGNLPPAVLIDLDPANGLLPLVSSNRASPDLVDYLARLRQRGVTVYWISGHAPNAAGRIRQRLSDSALDPDGIDPLIVTRFAGESKQERRYALGESNCLLAILGDHRGDFDELYDFVLDPIMAGPLEIHIGKGWFIAPPPLD